ncbi:MAG: hypothetical protein LUD18_11470 [Lachnospiraceae bacterium]|nr:hypothetical protein [Lachnospiraceae bacterium]
MKKQASDKSRLFFIEFLIVLFFFLIIGTVCLRVFAEAHSVTRNADALSRAQSAAASIAEVLEAGESIEAYFPEALLVLEESDSEENFSQTAIYEITFSSDFQECGANDAFYTLSLNLSTEGHNQTAHIIVADRTGDTLYELSVTCHLPLTREEALS